MGASWAVATTLPNAESKVALALSQINVDSIWFRRRKRMVHRGKVIERLYPAFPRYMFIKVGEAWRAVRETYGILDFVRFGRNAPELIDDKVIEDLRSLTIDDVFPYQDESGDKIRFQFGQKIRIMGTGAASGCEGVYQYSLGNSRALILVPWLGAWVPTTIDERDLEEFVERRSRRGRRGKRSGRRHRRRDIAPGLI